MQGYTVRQLLKVDKGFRDNPDMVLKVDGVFPSQQFTREQWIEWFRECLDRKISSHMQPVGGRKVDPDYQAELWRAQRELQTPRLRIHWLPKDLRERFADRLVCEE